MRRVPTANHGPRRGVDRPTLVVLHYTAMRGGPAPVVALFSRPDTELSAHYVLGEDGDVVAMVPEDRRAWHAGAGRWGGCADVNSASVGIEICNDGRAPFPAAQMDALEVLLDRILRRLPEVPPRRGERRRRAEPQQPDFIVARGPRRSNDRHSPSKAARDRQSVILDPADECPGAEKVGEPHALPSLVNPEAAVYQTPASAQPERPAR